MRRKEWDAKNVERLNDSYINAMKQSFSFPRESPGNACGGDVALHRLQGSVIEQGRNAGAYVLSSFRTAKRIVQQSLLIKKKQSRDKT